MLRCSTQTTKWRCAKQLGRRPRSNARAVLRSTGGNRGTAASATAELRFSYSRCGPLGEFPRNASDSIVARNGPVNRNAPGRKPANRSQSNTSNRLERLGLSRPMTEPLFLSRPMTEPHNRLEPPLLRSSPAAQRFARPTGLAILWPAPRSFENAAPAVRREENGRLGANAGWTPLLARWPVRQASSTKRRRTGQPWRPPKGVRPATIVYTPCARFDDLLSPTQLRHPRGHSRFLRSLFSGELEAFELTV